MPIKQLSDEQVATWSRLQKDTWWLKEVYRGDMPQLTIRAALTAAGFTDVRVELVPHLARAWGRRLPAWGLGLLGDLAAQPFPSRRSTIIADAKVPG